MREEVDIPQGRVITFKCSSAPPSSPLLLSSPLLPLPPPQGSRRRYEKVIMFPLEMACSPSTPFISKWNNLSTVACLFFSLHLHLSFQYTTHTPAVSFPFLSVFFFSLPTAAFHLFNPSLTPFFFFFFRGVEYSRCTVL